jgi:DNA polymerase-3 subunit alpha
MSECPSKLSLIPCHIHTVYSVLDGVSSIDQYIAWCKQNGAHALGISDHGWAIGLLELYDKCRKNSLTPLPGIEFYLAPDADYRFAKNPYAYFHVTAWAVTETGYRNLLKLASLSWKQDTLPGYRKQDGLFVRSEVNRVVKRFSSEKPRITFAELLEHSEGIALGSGCLIGSSAKAFLQGETEEAERNMLKLLEVFRGRFFAELMAHTVDHDWDRETKQFKKNECNAFAPDGNVQKAVNLQMVDLARKHNVPLLMTTDAHMCDHTEKTTQDLLLSNGDPSGWKFHNIYSMQSTQDTWDHWSERYGTDEENRKLFCEAVENTHALAAMAKDLKIEDRYHQPPPDVPVEIREATESPGEQRKLLLYRAIDRHGRMLWDRPEYVDRLEREIAVICDNGKIDFSDYFLFLEKWCGWAREHSVAQGVARGSAGGSLLAYLLKITHIDPVHWSLPFERFLSQGRINRGKYPDIDLDFGARDILTAALKAEYGDRYAQVSTHGTLKIKMAIKDAARYLLGWNSQDKRIDAVTKTVTNTPMGVKDKDFLLGYTDQEGTQHKGHLEENPTLQKFFQQYPDVYEMVIKLLGIPRSVGRHASAILVSDVPISETIPTCLVSGELCTQYTAAGANYVEKAGNIKFDILTVNNMQYVGDCIRLIQRERGYRVWEEKLKLGQEEFTVQQGELTIEQIPTGRKDDPETKILNLYDLPELPEVFQDLKDGNTKSLFQFHTPGMTEFCQRVQPNNIKELADIVSLDRPGPLDAEVVPGVTFAEAYIKRKHGKMAVEYAHPSLKPILKDTHGVFVYQEQIAATFVDCAGYSAEEADAWREMLSKKKKQDVEKFVPELRKRLEARGWTPEQSQVFIDACIAASQYSFGRAHALAYGYNGYITAFLKNKFPVEWWTAVLKNAKVTDIKEKRFDVAVRDILVMPHVNGPMTTFELRDGKIHAPLYLIDGIGDAACRAIQAERDKRLEDIVTSGSAPPDAAAYEAQFGSFQDFFERVKDRAVTSRVINHMILCGAFHQVEPDKSPRELMYAYYYLDRVSGLKAGRGKSGSELLDAACQYQEKHPEEAIEKIPYLSMTDVQLENIRASALAIYNTNVYDGLKDYFDPLVVRDDSGAIHWPTPDGLVRIARNERELAAIHQAKIDSVLWCGFVVGQKEFSYDKRDYKTGKTSKVKALKFTVRNDGEDVECVLWPGQYKELGAPKGDGIVRVLGNIKESKYSGKLEIFVDDYQEV